MGLEERKQSKEIEGVTYEVTPVPFGVGRPALMRLMKIVAPVASAAFKETSKQAMTAAVLDTLPSVLDDADLKYFASLFGPYTTIYKPGCEPLKLTDAQQDLHFAGDYLAYFNWIAFAIKVNYSSFFTGMGKGEGLGDLLGTMTAKK